MSTLAEHILAALTEEGLETTVESIQAAIDSFEAPKPKAKGKAKASGKACTKATTSTKPAPKAKAKSKARPKVEEEAGDDGEEIATESHSCEYTQNKKSGAEVCGKSASNTVGGMWYCGTENSGHYKSALANAAKAAPKGKAKGKAATLAAKIVKTKKLDLQEIPEGSGVWISTNPDAGRIAFEKKGNSAVAIGVLDEDDVSLLPLTKENVTFLETHNLEIRDDALKPKKGKVVPAKAGKVAKGKTAAPVKAAKGADKPAPKAKGAAKKAVPKAKAAPKAKGTAKAKAKAVEEELEEAVEDAAEDAEAELDLGEEDVDADAEGGDAGTADADAVEEDDSPDIEEAEEGEAAEDCDGGDEEGGEEAADEE